ncbi:hypothetical protein L218DRAFT_700652 [Marasmius fiardii PR-910]|nr:hypothetical protein L218DRAFT_700652 [Marasmius fiardii PR-910]
MSHDSPLPDFSHIFTPDFYSQVLKLQFPWNAPVDLKSAFRFYFLGESNISQKCFDLCHFHALKPISAMCPTIPSLRQYLPDPKDANYADHTLALIVLFDQMPRYSYNGVEARHVFNFFGQIGIRLVRELIENDVLPDSTQEWTTRLGPGASFEDAMIRKHWLYVPLVHSEELEDHELVSGYLESMRKEVEVYYGLTDPWRDRRDEDSRDVVLFSRLIKGGPPVVEGTNNADLWFWMLRVFESHKPIIEKFGRYPYRNETTGREDTDEEKEYLKVTENFGMRGLSDEDTRKLRDQVRDGVWEELSDKGPQGFLD